MDLYEHARPPYKSHTSITMYKRLIRKIYPKGINNAESIITIAIKQIAECPFHNIKELRMVIPGRHFNSNTVLNLRVADNQVAQVHLYSAQLWSDHRKPDITKGRMNTS